MSSREELEELFWSRYKQANSAEEADRLIGDYRRALAEKFRADWLCTDGSPDAARRNRAVEACARLIDPQSAP